MHRDNEVRHRIALRISALLGAITLASGAATGQSTQDPAIDASARCQQLVSTDFSGIRDAPAQVTEAGMVPAAHELPAYCRVQGYVSPQAGFEMRLPASTWNGKFLFVGCGAFCGSTTTSLDWQCTGPLRRGYTCIATDMGHKSTAGDGKWAYNNLQAEVDFGFRATHVVTLAGKAITERYYSKIPDKSYYMGCSTGGRQGLVEAQRFPWDFDGLIVGAPVVNKTDLLMDALWKYVVSTDESGKPIFSSDDLQLAHRSAVGRCDMDDGVKDGVIGDPRACKFDPSSLVCKSPASTGCLSERQVEALRKLYSGPLTSKGESITLGGAALGSEKGLTMAVTNGVPASVADFFRYMAFAPDPGPRWQARHFDFDRDYKRLGMMEALYGATNPDLRKLKAAGGKVILYQGWNDGGFTLNTIDYYETVVKTMGGRTATHDFMRLFLMPGMGHCTGGDGAFAFDYLSYLEAWVERDQAPDVMIGAHVTDIEPMKVAFPLDPTKIKFTRPVYPYPLRARYKGKGDINDAASFGPVSN